MALGKQAKIISDKHVRAIWSKSGRGGIQSGTASCFCFRPKPACWAMEIASVTWAIVTDAEDEIADTIALDNRAAKGRAGAIPMYPELRAALITLHQERRDKVRPELPVIHSERDRGLSAAAVAVWFHRLYAGLGMIGCSSHSSRRTLLTRAARKIGEVGGSLRDIQQLAGHSSLSTTARYIEGDVEAQRKVVALI
jgi:integrase/recombinase XerD